MVKDSKSKINFQSFPKFIPNKNDYLVKKTTLKLKSFIIKKDNEELKAEKDYLKKYFYKCPNCNRSYSSVTRYEVHLRTHTGEKPFECAICKKKFNEKGNLKAHVRIHTGERPFVCKYPGCKMAFKTKGQLNDHQNRHSNLRQFKCDICSSAFNRKTRLKVHKMIHTGEKPFSCTFPGCQKKFREKGNLNSHLKKHYKNCNLLLNNNNGNNNGNNNNDNDGNDGNNNKNNVVYFDIKKIINNNDDNNNNNNDDDDDKDDNNKINIEHKDSIKSTESVDIGETYVNDNYFETDEFIEKISNDNYYFEKNVFDFDLELKDNNNNFNNNNMINNNNNNNMINNNNNMINEIINNGEEIKENYFNVVFDN